MVSSQIKRNTELLERKEITRNTYKESEGEEREERKRGRAEERRGEEGHRLDSPGCLAKEHYRKENLNQIIGKE